jgi:hypothetical protein
MIDQADMLIRKYITALLAKDVAAASEATGEMVDYTLQPPSASPLAPDVPPIALAGDSFQQRAADELERINAAQPLMATILDQLAEIGALKDCIADRATPADHISQARDAWQSMATAPRDGRNILIRFGRDGVSQAMYVPGVPHPWKFIDTNDGITWLINSARDGEYGPSHWMPMPAPPEKPAGDI